MSQRGGLSRRAVLVGSVGLAVAAATVGADEGVLPGRGRLRSLLGQSSSTTGLPDVPAGRLESGTFVSQHRLGARCGWTLAYPSGARERLPVVIALHGRGVGHRAAFGNSLGLQRFLAQAGHRFAIASVDGGDTYWHRRATGEDAGAMVAQEFLPLLAGRGLDTSRIGLLGWSMGGFGAFWLAGVLGRERVAGVAAESPAIWHEAGLTAPGAFDDPADFAAHDVFSHPGWLAGVATRIDCGTSDGFYPAARDLAAALRPKPVGGFQPGGHDLAYWRARAPEQLAFLAGKLV